MKRSVQNFVAAQHFIAEGNFINVNASMFQGNASLKKKDIQRVSFLEEPNGLDATYNPSNSRDLELYNYNYNLLNDPTWSASLRGMSGSVTTIIYYFFI